MISVFLFPHLRFAYVLVKLKTYKVQPTAEVLAKFHSVLRSRQQPAQDFTIQLEYSNDSEQTTGRVLPKTVMNPVDPTKSRSIKARTTDSPIVLWRF